MIVRILADQAAWSACQAGDYATAANRLNAIATPTARPLEQSRYSWLGLQDRFGVERVAAWRVALKLAIANGQVAAASEADQQRQAELLGQAEALAMFLETMAAGGYAFADPRTVAQVHALAAAGVVSPADAADLIGLGQVAATVVTAQEVESDWVNYELGRATLRLAARRSAIVATLERMAATVANAETLPTCESVMAEIQANWPEA